ncbi:MAG: hypothetical protein C4323_11550 [Mastigocladus sp. ERB_26_2]
MISQKNYSGLQLGVGRKANTDVDAPIGYVRKPLRVYGAGYTHGTPIEAVFPVPCSLTSRVSSPNQIGLLYLLMQMSV